MLRILIGTGLLLMAVGFGAAGWQYWTTRPVADAVAAPGGTPTIADAAGAAPVSDGSASAQQSWLISPTGGLVPPEDVRAYLEQDRFVPGRVLQVTREARLADLLVDDEKLPEAAFLQVLADIRAPRVVNGLCQVLLDTIARDCAVQSARVVEGSVDPVAGTAIFRLELAYQLKQTADDLPDLATQVLRSDALQMDFESGAEGTQSPEAALAAMLALVSETCAGDTVGAGCRPLRLEVDWATARPVSARAVIAWLDPLPQGMFVAPPLDAGQGG